MGQLGLLERSCSVAGTDHKRVVSQVGEISRKVIAVSLVALEHEPRSVIAVR